MLKRRQPAALGPVLAAALLVLCSGASAEIYRNVDASGNVTFSDRPAASGAARSTGKPAAAGNAQSSRPLPWELEQTSKRYPVTLYTQSDCVPCTSGRNLLINRGIPFTEKTVQTNADIAAFRALSQSAELPLLTIGGQHLSGFSDQTWSQYLDAAGYPKTSRLPADWTAPAATPLAPAAIAKDNAPTTKEAAAEEARNKPSSSDADSLLNPKPSATNPAGLRF